MAADTGVATAAAAEAVQCTEPAAAVEAAECIGPAEAAPEAAQAVAAAAVYGLEASGCASFGSRELGASRLPLGSEEIVPDAAQIGAQALGLPRRRFGGSEARRYQRRWRAADGVGALAPPYARQRTRSGLTSRKNADPARR